MELMIQRRIYFDDWRGVEEPLNETDQRVLTHLKFISVPFNAKYDRNIEKVKQL